MNQIENLKLIIKESQIEELQPKILSLCASSVLASGAYSLNIQSMEQLKENCLTELSETEDPIAKSKLSEIIRILEQNIQLRY